MKRRIGVTAIHLVLGFLLLGAGAVTGVEVLEGTVEAAELLERHGPGLGSSSWSPGALNARIRQLTPRLQMIYQRHLDEGGTARGRLIVEMVLADNGYLERVAVVEDRLRDAALSKALLENIGDWYVLPNRDEKSPGALTLRYRFNFSYIVVQTPLAVESLSPDGEVPPMRRLYWLNNEINQRLKDINELYNLYLFGTPSLSGYISLEFALRHCGTIDNVVVVEETLNLQGLVDDIAAKVASWRLSPLADYGPEGDVRVTYTFNLTSAR